MSMPLVDRPSHTNGPASPNLGNPDAFYPTLLMRSSSAQPSCVSDQLASLKRTMNKTNSIFDDAMLQYEKK